MAICICLHRFPKSTRYLREYKRFFRRCYAAAPRRRVAVTGMGLVTCLGVGVNHVWNRLCEGQCGITSTSINGEYESLPCRVAGFIPRGDNQGELNLNDHFLASDLRNLPLSTAYALIAADEAIKDSKWKPEDDEDYNSAGVAIGTGMADLDYISQVGATLREKGVRKISPHFIPNILLNMPAGSISMKYGFKGPNHAVSTACSTGLVAIGDASSFIQRGIADVMVAGGTEACIGPLSLAGFSRLRALSTKFNDEPSSASRPFDIHRDGFVMSEGAGVVFLEQMDHAKRRGAKIYAEILGYGIVGDAFHMTAPQEDGSGAAHSMSSALKDGRLSYGDVGYINAHATSTPLGDIAECRAIDTVFGKHATNLLVSSTKGAVGHLQGAAGAVEAVFTILATQTGVIPPTVNLSRCDAENGLNCVPNVKQTWTGSDRRISLTNSFGFWGTNATLCIGQVS